MKGKNKGLSLVGSLLVVGGILLLLILMIPVGEKTKVSHGYSMIEKQASRLKFYAVQWAEKSMAEQDETHSIAMLADYYASLANQSGGVATGSGQQWIATTGSNNWNINEGATTNRNKEAAAYIPIKGRVVDDGNGDLRGTTIGPECTVEHLVPPDKKFTNVFTGESIFRSANYPPAQGEPVTGALAFGFKKEPASIGGYYYFAFAYQGEYSTTTDFASDATTFVSDMGLSTVSGLRNGVLFARIR